MANDEVFNSLTSTLRTSNDPRYNVQGGAAYQSPPQRFGSNQFADRSPTSVRQQQAAPRVGDGDRPSAYSAPNTPTPAAPSPVTTTEIKRFELPTLQAILLDLLLRILEVGIAAASMAIGQEIFAFFTKRRFHTQHFRG